MSVAEAALAEFSDAVLRLIGGKSGRLLLAVSGGPDSLALLILASQACADRIVAATVDHGLRKEAAAEADFVSNICASLGIAHHILRPAEPITGNIQSEARKVRYDLLRSCAGQADCRWIATAHHADDQLETMLMRLARGSGVSGLSAIREKNANIIRPLLSFTKTRLEDICAQAGINPVLDPSNADMHFDRVRMRQWLAKGENPLDPMAAVRSAAALAEADEALDWVTMQLAKERVAQGHGRVEADMAGLPGELQRRLFLHIMQMMEPQATFRGDAVTRALASLNSGGSCMLGNTMLRGGDRWTFAPSPPRTES